MARSINKSVSLAKETLADAIKACEEKEITVPPDIKISELASYINTIETYQAKEPSLVIPIEEIPKTSE